MISLNGTVTGNDTGSDFIMEACNLKRNSTNNIGIFVLGEYDPFFGKIRCRILFDRINSVEGTEHVLHNTTFTERHSCRLIS